MQSIATRSANASMLIDIFLVRNKGDLVTYQEMEAAIGCDPRSYISTVANRLRRDYGLNISNVRGVGYEILTDAQIVAGEMKRDRDHRRRSARRSKLKASTVDLSNLNEIQKMQLFSEVTSASIVMEESTDKSVKKINGQMQSQPLAMAKALDNLKASLKKQSS